MAHYKPNVGKLPLDAMVKIFAGCLWIYFVWPAPHMPRGRGEAHDSCLVNPSTRARGQCTIYKKLRSCSFDQFTFLFSPALPSNNFCGVVQINIFLVEVHMNARAIVHMPQSGDKTRHKFQEPWLVNLWTSPEFVYQRANDFPRKAGETRKLWFGKLV